MEYTQLHVTIGWFGMLAGAISGALIGLFFHQDGWAGGYASFRRRMLRLGHIAFFGIGFLNLMFGFTVQVMDLGQAYLPIASFGFGSAMLLMPLCCFLAAWHKPLRHLFALPVTAVMAGIIPVIVAGAGA